MIMIALEIFGYWIIMGLIMWLCMFAALGFAKTCEFLVDSVQGK